MHDCTDPWRKPGTLILQAGFSRTSKFWFGMVPHLMRHYRVVCPDLRGQGESGTDFDKDKLAHVSTYLEARASTLPISVFPPGRKRLPG